MDYKAVEAAEAEFRATGRAPGKQYTFEEFSIPIPGEELNLDGVLCRPENGFEGYFYKQNFTKEKIVLHFTVGHLKGDILSLTSEKRGHVSTSFVVARDGTVYQLFSSGAWSYHLGRNAQGGNANQSKVSIGIEISNYGPLIKKDNELHTVYSKVNDDNKANDDVYCTLDDTEQYIKLPEKFRGYEYYASFTDEQYHSIIVLLRYLTSTYKIPRKFVEEANRFKTSFANSAGFKGITSHVNFRSDKVDIGPAFDWDRVIEGVTAEVYTGNLLEAAVEKAKQKVADAKQAIVDAYNALSAAEAELEAAQSALTDSDVVPRGITAVIDKEEDIPEATARGIEGEDDSEPFDIDKSPFYED
jgi:N-acetyl-anhydromuramyl-L-alanine amidase AmpD